MGTADAEVGLDLKCLERWHQALVTVLLLK